MCSLFLNTEFVIFQLLSYEPYLTLFHIVSNLVLTLLSTSVATTASVSGKDSGKAETCSGGIEPENQPMLVALRPPVQNSNKTMKYQGENEIFKEFTILHFNGRFETCLDSKYV